ncbi:MAG: hypothetical protein IPK13_17580 [Deltaproteobacteria bacterium]|nr:hypothetical protein [Deltaproteobacteria bacterium]
MNDYGPQNQQDAACLRDSASFVPGAARLEDVLCRIAERREAGVPFLTRIRGALGALGPELEAWCRLFERYEMEVCDPSGVELRLPNVELTLRETLETAAVSSLADLVGFYAACSVVVQADEMSYLASWAGSASGASRVYTFHPNDWGLWFTDGALSARLYRLLQEDREVYRNVRFDAETEAAIDAALSAFELRDRASTWSAHLDPPALFERSRWLIHALVNVGGDFCREVASAAPWSSYAGERALIPRMPHLAAYWLWSHFFFEETEALQETLELTQTTKNPLVQETRTLVRELGSKKRTKLGHRTSEMILERRTMFAEEVPEHLLSEASRSRRRSRGASSIGEGSTEQRALSALREAGRGEPLVAEALVILEHLSTGGARRPDPVPIRGGMAVDAAMDRLAELVDARFAPVIWARLQRAARVPDTHRHAGWGLLLAQAAIVGDFERFEQSVTALGTQHLGVRRLTELFRAYGRFQEPAATEALARGAQVWLNQLDDWIRTVPDEPVRQLLERDTLRSHELMTALLERAPFTAPNWEMCVRAACAAGTLRSKRAIAGLRRAVQLKLGRVEDGTRARIVVALAQVEGPACDAFLRVCVRAALESVERAALGRAVESGHARGRGDGDAERGLAIGAGVDADADVGACAGAGANISVSAGHRLGARADVDVVADVDVDDLRFTTEKDVACLLSGLLALEPDDPETRAWVLERFRFFLPILRGRRPPKKDSLEAVLAILHGLRLGDGRGWADEVRCFETLDIKETRSTHGKGDEIREAARAVRRQSA